MFHVERCRECGDVKPLDVDGVCRWRAGCEHRQLVHETTMARLDAALARLDQPNVSPLLAQMAEWQRQAYEHVQELIINGETIIDGGRWYVQGYPCDFAWPDEFPTADAPWVGPYDQDDE